MPIVDPAVEGYLEELTASNEPVLAEMEEEGRRRGFPIVGPQVGRLLCQLAAMIEAERVLELGSGFGYSAAWWAMGMSGGELILTDFSADDLGKARSRLRRLGPRCRIRCLKGDGLEILEELAGEFDVIFNDVEKHQYPQVLDRAPQRLRRGGLLVSDNVLWHGRVVEPGPDEDTRAVLEYNRRAFTSPGLMSTLIPLRDGVAVSLKL